MYRLGDYLQNKYKKEFAQYKKDGYQSVGLLVNTLDHDIDIPPHVTQLLIHKTSVADMQECDYVTTGPMEFTTYEKYSKDLEQMKKLIHKFQQSI